MARLRKNVREAPISIQLAPRCCFFALDSFVARHCLFPLAPLTFTFDLRNESMVFEVWTCNRTTKPWNLYRYNRLSLSFFYSFALLLSSSRNGFYIFRRVEVKKIISHEKDIYIYICGEWSGVIFEIILSTELSFIIIILEIDESFSSKWYFD